jgi:hypothetical protein
LKNYRRTKRTIHFLKHAKHVSQGTTRIDDQHVKTPTLTWEKTNSRVSLYRGSTAVSDELAGYWHGTTPTTRLVWTTWDPTVAFRFSQPHHAASVSSLRHEEQGVFVFAVKKPIPHLLHVTTCQPASTKSIHQAVMVCFFYMKIIIIVVIVVIVVQLLNCICSVFHLLKEINWFFMNRVLSIRWNKKIVQE